MNKIKNAQIELTITDLNVKKLKIEIKELQEYKGKNGDNDADITFSADKLGNLDNNYIKFLLRMNLSSIFMNKLTGINKTKIDVLKNFTNFSNKERMKIINYIVLEICAIYFDIKPETNSKKFIATIEIIKNYKSLEKEISIQQVRKYFECDINCPINYITPLYGLATKDYNENIDKIHKSVMQKINFDEIKSMYELIKEKRSTIEIDLTDLLQYYNNKWTLQIIKIC